MREHNVARRQRGRELIGNLKKRVIVRHKNLQIVAHLRDLRGRTDEVWDPSQGPIPDENVEPLLAKVRGNSGSNNPETDHSDIFSHSMGHVAFCAPRRSGRWRVIRLKLNQPAGNAEVYEFPGRLPRRPVSAERSA